jgi:23S rRNA-/tRNA-specific pseudouridylate synthase
MDLDVLFEDEHIIVLNKSAGLTVHPAPGNRDGTLVNGLLHHCPDLPGISGNCGRELCTGWIKTQAAALLSQNLKKPS